MNTDSFDFKVVRAAFIAAMISGLIAYGFELSHFTLSIDEETMDNFLHMVDFGRWGHAALKEYIFPEPWAPFYSLFFALAAISASASACSIFLRLNVREAILFSAIFASFPQMAYQLQFSNQSETVGLAVFLSAISAIFFRNKGFYGSVSFVILNIFVASIYQSLIFFSATLITISILKQVCDGETGFYGWVKESLKVAILLLASVILYLVITKVIKDHYNLHSVSYFSSMISWGQVGIAEGLINTWNYIKTSAYTIPYYGLNFYFISSITIILSCLSSLRFGARTFALSIIICFIVIISPFFLNIIIGAGTPARTLSQMPLVFSAGILLLARHFKKDAIHYALASVFVLTSCSYTSKMFYSDFIASEQDKRIAFKLMSDIHEKYPETKNKYIKLITHGSIEQVNPWVNFRSDDFGVSFFQRGISSRIGRFIYTSGIGNVTPAGEEELTNEQRNILSGMEVWDGRKGIEYKDGVVIVKLSQ